VAVAGAGPAGAALALALTGAGARTLLIDGSPGDGALPSGYDTRPIALSEGSRRILAGLGCWEGLASSTMPIERVHVSERGVFGTTVIEAAEMGVEALGQVLDARALGQVLFDALGRVEGLESQRRVSVALDGCAGDHVALSLRPRQATGPAEPVRVAARLLVAADGAGSPLRARFGIGARVREYGQTAITARVRTARDHERSAFERFTADGPLALLPLPSGYSALVWTLPDRVAEQVAALPLPAFLDALGQAFGGRLGEFVEAKERARYSLRLVCAGRLVGDRLCLVGNAAQSLHPVAGQGLNLGLRDVAALADLVACTLRTGGDIGAPEVLGRYARARASDRRTTIGLTDGLARVFVIPGLGPVRGLGLLVAGVLPPFKRRLARQTMGVAGRSSRLLRGLAP
jgi:2-octaprenyl-6-methoxyphenol hydroxylase